MKAAIRVICGSNESSNLCNLCNLWIEKPSLARSTSQHFLEMIVIVHDLLYHLLHD
jgi:hypothetical protein